MKLEEETSNVKQIGAGVPQLSVLGPLLFNIYTADIPPPKRAEIAQFADDTMLYYSSRNLSALDKALTDDLRRITKWYNKWRIKINEQKAQAIHFTHRQKRPDEIPINGYKIPWQSTVKYLGVTLDQKLTYSKHTKEITRGIGIATSWLYPLINRKSKLDLHNKTRLIKTMIIPIATYAGEIWHQCSDNLRQKIQGKINKIFRMAADSPWYISNKQLRKELNYQTLEEIIYARTTKTIDKIQTHSNEIIRQSFNIFRKIKKEGIQQIKRRAEEKNFNIPSKRQRVA